MLLRNFPRIHAHVGELSFNVHGIIYVSEEGESKYLRPYLPDCVDIPFSLTADVTAPVEREIRSLAIGLTSVKDEQEYIVVRERRHRDTAESTCERVKWWSVLQALVLFSVVAWQVYYLKVCCRFAFMASVH